jgi:hypothetical protein
MSGGVSPERVGKRSETVASLNTRTSVIGSAAQQCRDRLASLLRASGVDRS